MDHVTSAPAADTRPGAIVRHCRQVFLWPVYLLPLGGDGRVQDHAESLLRSPENHGIWQEVADEFTGDPSQFHERHYGEFVTFLPPVQRFLYGQGVGKSVRGGYGESPIRVLRRSDVAAMRVTLSRAAAPVTLGIAHVDLYLFYDTDIAILVVEVLADDLPLSTVQDLMFRVGRAYPAYWEPDGSGGHCPALVEWIGHGGAVLACSDYENRQKYLEFVCRHRSPAIAAHWEFLMQPLVPHYSDAKGLLRYRQLEYYRMPMMAYLALEDHGHLTHAERMRLALALAPGEHIASPQLSERQIQDFEARFCLDNVHDGPLSHAAAARFMTCGHALVVTGDAHDPAFAHAERGTLGAFRHQHFLVFLVAHFHKAALQMFSDQLAGAVNRLDVRDYLAVQAFRADTRLALETFLRFTHRYWFLEVSRQEQARELFSLCRRHLDLDRLYDDVRQEVQDMSQYLEAEAGRRQNETMMRLTVVTAFGLVGTVATGFLGMNLFSHSEQPPEVKLAIFFTVFVPTAILTLYTIGKSRRLSEFLDALSDEKSGGWTVTRAFLAIWWPRKLRK
ncbi:MAG: CorA family divalent cation transporter [Hyphomicrobiaceae bacterium]|nr:CorA family divalent cation transporter [Hyphomicrobiaceae bacterium]